MKIGHQKDRYSRSTDPPNWIFIVGRKCADKFICGPEAWVATLCDGESDVSQSSVIKLNADTELCRARDDFGQADSDPFHHIPSEAGCRSADKKENEVIVVTTLRRPPLISPLQVKMITEVLVDQPLNLGYRTFFDGLAALVITCVWPMNAEFISCGTGVGFFIQARE